MSNAEYRANEEADELLAPGRAAADVARTARDIGKAADKGRETKSKAEAGRREGSPGPAMGGKAERPSQNASGPISAGQARAEQAAAGGTASSSAAAQAGAAAGKGIGSAIESAGAEIGSAAAAAAGPALIIIAVILIFIVIVAAVVVLVASLDSDPRTTLLGAEGAQARSQFEEEIADISKEDYPNAYAMYEDFIELGLTKEASAAIVGNFLVDVGYGHIDLSASEDTENMIGIARWTGPRKKHFIEYCEDKSLDANDIGVQAQFVKDSIEGGRWYHNTKSEMALVIGAFLAKGLSPTEFETCDDIEQAVAAFLASYEDTIRGAEDGCDDLFDGKRFTRKMRCEYEYGKRLSYAKAVYRKFH